MLNPFCDERWITPSANMWIGRGGQDNISAFSHTLANLTKLKKNKMNCCTYSGFVLCLTSAWWNLNLLTCLLNCQYTQFPKLASNTFSFLSGRITALSLGHDTRRTVRHKAQCLHFVTSWVLAWHQGRGSSGATIILYVSTFHLFCILAVS